jgi:HEAT repeats
MMSSTYDFIGRDGTLRLVHSILLFMTSIVIIGSAVGKDAVVLQPPADQNLYLKDYGDSIHKIHAGFIPKKPQLVLGEPLEVMFVVENCGSATFEFWFGGDYRGTGRHDRFKICVTNATGEALPDPIARAWDMGGLVQQVSLQSGHIFTNVIDLTRFRVIDKPGIYTVSCRFALDDHQENNKLPLPVIASTFKLTILERTPERVSEVLDELIVKAQSTQGQELTQTLALIARFGKEDALPHLTQLAEKSAVELRVSAIGALTGISTQASLDALLSYLKDPDPQIRIAAAGSLGAMKKPRGIDALLDALPNEKSPVAGAIVLALGTSKDERVFPVIINTLDRGEPVLQKAAINALVNFGGSNAVAALSQRINTTFLPLRYEIVLALADKLREPMQAEWLLPVLMGREYGTGWLDSLGLLRMYGGEKAIPILLSCLDFDVPWSSRNWWLLEQGVKPCRKAPPIDYQYDPNSDGTPEQWQKNLQLLRTLKPLAGPVPEQPIPAAPLKVSCLLTDPPIDFLPTYKESPSGDFEIKSGFLDLALWRCGSRFHYSVPDSYRAIYHTSSRMRSLAKSSARCTQVEISFEQLQQLKNALHQFAVNLCGSNSSDQSISNAYTLLVSYSDDCPSDDAWGSLLADYKEAPCSLREQAKANLINSVQVRSQNYHSGTIEFVEAAKKYLPQHSLSNC